jgi:hypothetical protein
LRRTGSFIAKKEEEIDPSNTARLKKCEFSLIECN